MRYMCLILVFAGCANSSQIFTRTKPADAPRALPNDDVLDSLQADGLYKVQVRDGKIVASEPVPGGLTTVKSALFEVAAGEQNPRPPVP